MGLQPVRLAVVEGLVLLTTLGTGIGTAVDPLESTITNFEAATATGGVFLSNTGALSIGGVTGALSGVDVTGASGAISAGLGAYIVMFPRSRGRPGGGVMDFIFIDDMRVEAHVGIFEREKAAPQTLEISLTFGVPDAAAQNDDIEQTIRYDAVIDHLGRRGLVDILPVSSLHFVFRRDLIDLWQAHGLTGFSATPVHVIGWSKRTKKPFPTEVPEYALVRPSAFVRLEEPPPLGPPCPVCSRVAYAFPKLTEPLPHGVQIDESSWDGSSIFGVLRLGFLFCTREVAELTLRAGYSKHFGFTRVEELYTAEPYDRRGCSGSASFFASSSAG